MSACGGGVRAVGDDRTHPHPRTHTGQSERASERASEREGERADMGCVFGAHKMRYCHFGSLSLPPSVRPSLPTYLPPFIPPSSLSLFSPSLSLFLTHIHTHTPSLPPDVVCAHWATNKITLPPPPHPPPLSPPPSSLFTDTHIQNTALSLDHACTVALSFRWD
jgi:hypothetical protein